MQQYYAIKAKYPDALLLFRVGDFYETFGEDAIRASRILGIVLTKRKNGAASTVELAGFPHHSLDVYLPKLVRSGARVAICDQLEDPKQTKTIVKRGVTELVTPGISFRDQILDSNKNNFLASVHLNPKLIGAAFLDVSTGEFYVAEGDASYIEKLLASFDPSEVIYERSRKQSFESLFGNSFHTFHLEDWAFQEAFGRENLTRHFGTHSLKGFGVDTLTSGIVAAGAALHYLADSQHNKVEHISSITRVEMQEHVWLDRFTQQNLELFATTSDGGKSLLDVLNHTVTPMGSRMLKKWLAFPLNQIEAIEKRQNRVECVINQANLREKCRDHFRRISDLERIVSRLAIGKLSPKEAVQLMYSLREVAPVAQELEVIDGPFETILARLQNTEVVTELIDKYIHEDAPMLLSKGMVIKEGISEELDELRALSTNGKDHLVGIQQRETASTGISSLKIGFNNVFGYYLEVTNSHKDKVPAEWTRKQTLVNAERYITEELKGYEQKILGAEDKIQVLEADLYRQFLVKLADHISAIKSNAWAIAELDCYVSFAENALNFNYCRPELNMSHELNISQGRHPVIEQELPLEDSYVPNNVLMNSEEQQIIMLTGPNMAGKSALLRQTALISLMAQIGSWVPAASAQLGIIDKLFSRVGASDNISQGESTFMVEMNETASILNNLSSRSLILLDEIGRGTSTYDGISIAWAIAEYLHAHPSKPLTLFATHYHELNEMTDRFERIKNFTIAIRETKDKIVFLRTLIPGGSEHSFGIHVAKMAGMPASLVKRAQEVLLELEGSGKKELNKGALKEVAGDLQMSFFQLDDPVLSQIKDEITNMEINSLTPVEALFKLNEIKKLLGTRD